MTLGSGITVHGRGYVGGSGIYVSNNTITNQGTITADVPGQTLYLSPVTCSSQGTLSCTGGGIMNLAGAFNSSTLGTFNSLGGVMNLTGTCTNSVGPLVFNAATGSWSLLGGTVIGGTAFVATASNYSALRLYGGSVNLSLTSSTFKGSSLGAGVLLDAGNSGLIALTSNTITGGRWGVSIATMTCGLCDGNLAITSMTFSGGLSAGATAIHFLGGTFPYAYTSVTFNDANINVNVNEIYLNAASTITMRSDAGLRTGPD